MLTKLNSIIIAFIIACGSIAFSNAAEINLPGFTGSVNSTVTSGLSMRVERNCSSVRGYQKYDSTYRTWVASNVASADQTPYLTESEGCADRKTDGYGNDGYVPRNLISENADDGNMNFDSGDFFDATSRVFTEISGSTDTGVNMNLSFVGSYNAIDSLHSPSWYSFTADELDKVESNVDVLDAYLTAPVGDVDITAGRFVTNWGESTFIPIGMNGLTTNAIDLVALRKPGSSIREALVPTEQVTVSGYLDGGWSYEAYYQFSESHVKVDEAGTFFGSEVVNGKPLIMAADFGSPTTGDGQSRACGILIASTVGGVGANLGCNATALAYFNTAAGKQLNATYLYEQGLKNMFYNGANSTALIVKAAVLGGAANTGWGGTAGDISTLGATNTAAVLSAMQNWDEDTKKNSVKRGTVDVKGNGHIFADGEDQYGLSLRTYLDDVGTGVDLGFYFSQYDSKVPYFRFKGQQGLVAGDLLGMYTLAAASGATLSTYLGAMFVGDSAVTLDTAETGGKGQITLGLADVAYGEGACGAYMNPKLANAMYGKGDSSNFLYTSEEKSNALRANYTNIGGILYHDALKCATNAAIYGTATTQQQAAALLGAALGPLNMAEYEFIYPENIKVLGMSANTNIGSTTVQTELTYRPNFPLATSAADQGQQLSDAVGTTNLLAQAVAQGIYAVDPTYSTSLGMYKLNVNGSATATTLLSDIKNFNRSYLPRIGLDTIAAGDFYTTAFLERDTWTATLGTTTIFAASHPITEGFGADSTVLLTEFGAVYVPELDDSLEFVGRGGYSDGVGGVKCGGVTQAGPTFNSTKAADGLTHLGSSQTDPLFGNGSYCESQNGADDLSLTYRLIGSATYNNVANSAWSFSPSFVWSHDFYGYGPSSMGGFVPGKQSLSLSGNFSKNDMSLGISYVNQLGDKLDNTSFDRDYLSANVSYSF